MAKKISKETIGIVAGGFIVGVFVAPALGAYSTIGLLAGGGMIAAGLVDVVRNAI